MVKKLILIFIILILLFASPAFAADYHVDATGGAANWAACAGADPGNGNRCSVAQANTSADDDDVVYLYDDGGVFTTAIQTSNSGSAGHYITFQAAAGESPTWEGAARGFYFDNISYIIISGITVHNPTTQFGQIRNSSHHIEIASSTFYDDDGDTADKGLYIWDACGGGTYTCAVHDIWIHDSTFHDIGTVGATPGCQDENGGPVLFGALVTGPTSDHAGYNITFEDNLVYHGSHHAMETYFYKMVIRNNIYHNEGWMTPDPACYLCYVGCSNDKFGNRNLTVKGHDSDNPRNYNLVEGNRFGHAGCPPDAPDASYPGGGGQGLVIGSQGNLVRYNYTFDSNESGIYFKALGWGSTGRYNHAYNNTLYKNAQRPACRTPTSLDNGMTFAYACTNNAIKNNLIYDSNSQADIWCISGGGGLYNCSTRSQTFSNNWITSDGDPLFINTDISDDSSLVLPDLSLQSGSGAIDGGTYLTQASGSGSNSTTLIVDDAAYFQDGTWGADMATLDADYIAIGTVSNTVQISSINYATNTITLAAQKSWADNANIWLAKKSDGGTVLYGSAPDQGAYESLGSVAATGTLTANITESGLVAGGLTLVYTLTGTTWVATAGDNNAITQAIIDGLDSNKAEAAGWDAVVKAELTHTSVVRTSDTILTITLPAFDGGAYSLYNITDDETITGTIPATAVESASAIVATPTVTIEDEQIAVESVSASYDSNGPAADYDVNGPDWIAP